MTLSHQNASNEAETARNLQSRRKSPAVAAAAAAAAAAEAAEWGRAVVAEAAIWPPRE
jgi:hypothetical protein